jgi:hypothetical protein
MKNKLYTYGGLMILIAALMTILLNQLTHIIMRFAQGISIFGDEPLIVRGPFHIPETKMKILIVIAVFIIVGITLLIIGKYKKIKTSLN